MEAQKDYYGWKLCYIIFAVNVTDVLIALIT